MASRDPEMQKLVNEAASLREREQPPPASVPAEQPARRCSPVNRRVYFHVHRDSIGMLYFLSGILVVPGGYFLGIVVERSWVGHAILGLYLARFVWFWIGYWLGWRRFKVFPGNIGLPVDGWPGLVAMCQTVETWIASCEIAIECLPDADLELIGAVGDLFRKAANGCFYTPGGAIGGAASDPRKEWQRDGLSLRGSVNACVLGEVYRLLRRLDEVRRRGGGIRRVKLSAGGSSYSIPRPSYDSGI